MYRYVSCGNINTAVYGSATCILRYPAYSNSPLLFYSHTYVSYEFTLALLPHPKFKRDLVSTEYMIVREYSNTLVKMHMERREAPRGAARGTRYSTPYSVLEQGLLVPGESMEVTSKMTDAAAAHLVVCVHGDHFVRQSGAGEFAGNVADAGATRQCAR